MCQKNGKKKFYFTYRQICLKYSLYIMSLRKLSQKPISPLQFKSLQLKNYFHSFIFCCSIVFIEINKVKEDRYLVTALKAPLINALILAIKASVKMRSVS